MLSLLFALCLSAHAQAHETIWDVKAHKFIDLTDLQAQAGDIFVFGEEHAVKGSEGDPETALHHANQVRLIRQLQTAHTVSVGIEFLSYIFQNDVDDYLSGHLSEADFLVRVGWGSNPFRFYREQILATRSTAGKTIALNIPMDIANQVAKGGKDSLTARQQALLPPFWERGNDAYFARFAEEMQGHAPPEAIERYFWAQSLWDDTMAWRALEQQNAMPDAVQVIIVGEFHVQYGGGLPFELRRHGAKSVKTMVQIAVSDWADSTLQDAIRPDPKWSEAADYLWIHQRPAQ